MRNDDSGQGKGTGGSPQTSLEQEGARLDELAAEKRLSKETNSQRGKLLSKMKTGKGKRIINELYRPTASIGDGGTADALIHEADTGVKPGDTSHYQKATDRAKEINNSIARGLVKGDEEELIKQRDKLIEAIKYWEKKHGK